MCMPTFVHPQYVQHVLILEVHDLLQPLSQIVEYFNYVGQHIPNFGNSSLDGIVPTTDLSY